MGKGKLLLGATLGGMLVFSPVPSCVAQSSSDIQELKRQIEVLLEGQEAMKKDIAYIKFIAQGNKPPLENVHISIEGGHSIGDENAPVTIVEFADYQCPFCARHFTQTMAQLKERFINTGKARYVYMEYPLERLHPLAFKAAEAAQCAGEQGKYWEMHDRLFQNQSALAANELAGHATTISLDLPAFRQCLDSGKNAQIVRSHIAEGQKHRVTGTPAFFIGVLDDSKQSISAVSSLSGAQPYTAFEKAINSVLNPPERITN